MTSMRRPALSIAISPVGSPSVKALGGVQDRDPGFHTHSSVDVFSSGACWDTAKVRRCNLHAGLQGCQTAKICCRPPCDPCHCPQSPRAGLFEKVLFIRPGLMTLCRFPCVPPCAAKARTRREEVPPASWHCAEAHRPPRSPTNIKEARRASGPRPRRRASGAAFPPRSAIFRPQRLKISVCCPAGEHALKSTPPRDA